jgi:hypothetical protein
MEDRAKAIGVFYAASPFLCGRVTLADAAGNFSWLGLEAGDGFYVGRNSCGRFWRDYDFYLTDWPRERSGSYPLNATGSTASWKNEKRAKQKIRSYTIWQAFAQRDVIPLTLAYSRTTGGYGVAFWLPRISKRLSGAKPDMRITLRGAAFILLDSGAATERMAFGPDLARECQRFRFSHAEFLYYWAVIYGSSLAIAVALFCLVGASYYSFHPCFGRCRQPSSELLRRHPSID